MSSYLRARHSIFYMLWLILYFFPFGDCAICRTCGGEACDGSNAANCPWTTAITSNAAAVVSATGGAIMLGKLLSPKLLRVFPMAVCNVISCLVAKPKGGAEVDPTGKSLHEIYVAVEGGILSKQKARMAFSERMQAATGATAADDKKEIMLYYQMVDKAQPAVAASVSSAGGDGPFMFVLCKISNMISKSNKIDALLCQEVEAESSEGSSSSSSKAYTSTLVRPSTSDDMYSILNLYVIMLVTSGLCHTLAITNFLEAVVYEPVRRGRMPWFVAFELMILYLLRVEDEPGTYYLSNVVSSLGGLDSFREEAVKAAKACYPSSFFRTHGGNPVHGLREEETDAKSKKRYSDKVKGFNKSALTVCQAWNKGTLHMASDVSADGTCRHFHGCSQFLVAGTDGAKGKLNQCFGDHKVADCPRPAAEKSDKPSRA